MVEQDACSIGPDGVKNCMIGDKPIVGESFNFNVKTDAQGLKKSIQNHLRYSLARDETTARRHDWWMATCLAIRDRITERYMKTQKVHHVKNVRRAHYLSMEYLMGRLLTDNLYNTGLHDIVVDALTSLGLDYEDIRHEEVDMGLGNGGLGRLAACFLDSLATLEYPAIGYGIHYEFGLFKQEFVDGRQVEHPDNWLRHGNPWQISRPEYSQEVNLYGRVELKYDDCGDCKPVWVDAKTIIGVPWDIPIVGYGACTVNTLRLWESRSTEEFDLKVFNEGGYVDAVHEKVLGETVSKVLYPNDAMEAGKELRLVQQHFFVSCSIKDIIRRYKRKNEGFKDFTEKVAIQLNDTHPAIAVPELMRLLIDEEGFGWDDAWSVCKKVFGYTNHTLLPEALEKWSVELIEKILPRHIQIIYEINHNFLKEVAHKWPDDPEKQKEMSIIEEGETRMVRMAYLAVVASHSVNGVAELHTQLLKKNLLHNFYELYPTRFNNKTNGITPRRWLKACNPRLSKLIDSKIGESWPIKLEKLKQLEQYADDKDFQQQFMDVKLQNKKHLANVIKDLCNVTVNPEAMFDVQIKRLHEYKRQHLNLLHIVTLYYKLLHDKNYDISPRVFIFGAKAAPSYYLAKDIIYAINSVAAKINADKRINDKLKVVFLPDYNVSLASQIIPAADLSEQISTAGKEASGTGNMKLALNGALTIGTLDGANVEIREEVGDENIFIFGHTVEEISAMYDAGYDSKWFYNNDPELQEALDWLCSGFFTDGDTLPLNNLRQSLLERGDPFFVLADYKAYCEMQEQVDVAFKDKARWAKMAILNTARVGKFSSDRTIDEYARDVWRLEPVPVGQGVVGEQC